MRKIGYLGPKGTYTEKAAQNYIALKQGQLVPLESIPEIFWAVREGEVELGIVPIENSIEGSVNQTLDLLVQEVDIEIRGEIILPVEHALMAKENFMLEDIKRVISHGQALAQCSGFLERSLKGVEVTDAVSTGQAAQIVAASPEPLAVIGHPEIARLYGLKVLSTGIANCKHNVTRFIIIGLGEGVVENPGKTSVLFSIIDRPGGLYQVLKEFARSSINLTKIESRPAKNGLGNYLFFVDFSGHPKEELVMECLSRVREISTNFRVLGVYEAVNVDLVRKPGQAEVSLEQIRDDIDIIDRQIVELLAKRTELVNVVGELKGLERKVRDKNRERQVLDRLSQEAVNKGVSPALIRKLYGVMFDHFVDLQESERRKKLSKILQRKRKINK